MITKYDCNRKNDLLTYFCRKIDAEWPLCFKGVLTFRLGIEYYIPDGRTDISTDITRDGIVVHEVQCNNGWSFYSPQEAMTKLPEYLNHLITGEQAKDVIAELISSANEHLLALQIKYDADRAQVSAANNSP